MGLRSGPDCLVTKAERIEVRGLQGVVLYAEPQDGDVSVAWLRLVSVQRQTGHVDFFHPLDHVGNTGYHRGVDRAVVVRRDADPAKRDTGLELVAVRRIDRDVHGYEEPFTRTDWFAQTGNFITVAGEHHLAQILVLIPLEGTVAVVVVQIYSGEISRVETAGVVFDVEHDQRVRFITVFGKHKSRHKHVIRAGE